ncbi:hypothetical protein BP6252_04938 [Coleophoma cylindrospora]|uniref:Uncharacterized protein n=1 Tax=Coleophoma cylindrospora TaxID=1849047 RepID=A0A3D8S2B8_9HELO|nr:hypothetical protein BP6252_04938 [Coleophoma cylindrospora]
MAESYLIEQKQMLKASQNTSSVEYSDYSHFNLQMAPLIGPGDNLLPVNNRSEDTALTQFQDSFEAQFQDGFEPNYLNSLPSPRPSTRGDPMICAVDNIIPLEGTNNSTNDSTSSSPNKISTNSNTPVSPLLQQHRQPEQQGLGYFPRAQIPSLREIRALNSPSAALPSLALLFSDAKYKDSQRITNEFTTFCSTIFSMHAEIAGITGVVGEYLTWVRKSRTAEPNFAAILEMLEARVREVQEMAEMRPRDPWGTLLDTLKKGTLDAKLFAMISSFEIEAHERAEKTRRFFQESYDVSFKLSEQMPEELKE